METARIIEFAGPVSSAALPLIASICMTLNRQSDTRSSVDLAQWFGRIIQARRRIYALAAETPVTPVDDTLFAGSQVYLKREDLQKTGSFKLRGATNKILSLPDDVAAQGVVTSSTGNHGLAVATAAQHRGIGAEVFVSAQVSPKKLRMIEECGARLHTIGHNPLEAELAARAAAMASNRTYISPYNDAEVIAGQGTIAAELLSQLPEIDLVYVAVGGGGLIGGIGAFFKQMNPSTEIVACWPENSRVMYECLRAGAIRQFPEEPTISESTAGGVEPGSLTFDLCRQVIDRSLLLPESEILEAMRWAHARGWFLEGAAGVAVAACFREAANLHGKTAAIVACGGNTSPEVLQLL